MRKQTFLSILFFVLTSIIYGQESIPYSESFESGFGAWTQLTTDNFDWTRYSGSTPTEGTGPSEAQDGDYYIYIEATGHNDPPQVATIEATFDFSNATMPIMSFYYHMYGDSIGNLRLLVFNGTDWVEVWNDFQNRGDQWNHVYICLGDYAGMSEVKMRFRAETQYSDLSDIALDNIQIVDFKVDNVSHTDVTCGGYSDGTLTITVSGGYGPYFYSIDDGVNYVEDANTSHQFTGLDGGDYVIRAKDISGCYVSGGVETIDEPPTPDISVTKTDVTPCEYSNNGTIEIDVQNGNPPYEYSIHGFDGPFQSSNYFDNLAPGTYEIAVKESTGCIADGGTTTITAPYAINIYDIQVEDVETCYGDSTGSLKIIAGGGHTPLEYSINEGADYQTENYFPDLPAGDYRFIIRDAQGCLDTSDYVTISQPTQVVINSITKVDITGCYGDKTGSINIQAGGGTGDIEYSIDNGYNYQDTGYFGNLAAGTYHVRVRDENNCQADGGEVVLTQPTKVVIDSVVKEDVSGCYGNANGKITIYAHGGSGSMYYSIDRGQNYSLLNEFTNLDVGTYFPYVHDQNGCPDSAEAVQITQPTQLEIAYVTKHDVEDCYGNNSGVIQIFAQNGTPPYQYSIDGGNTYQSDYTFNNLYAGEYHTAVKDNNGCEVLGDTVVITQPSQIQIDSVNTTDVSCNGQADGTVYVHAYGGTGALKYSIDGGTTFPFDNGQIVSQPAGSYPIAVKDENNCTITGPTLTINEPDSLKIVDIQKVDVQGCYGDSTGEITIYVQGGTPPYQYSIDNGLTFQDSAHFTNLPAKTGYLPFVRDAHGCVAYADPVTIGQPPQLIVNSITHTDVDTCYGVPAGTITVTASGGTGTIYYSIDSGQNFFDNGGFFDNLYAGTYYIKVKDSHNCLADGWAETIHQPDSLILDSVKTWDVVCYNQGNGKIYVYAHGGQPQLTYSIDGGVTFTPSYQFVNLGPGNYHVVVKDNFNCRVDTTVSLSQPPQLFLDSVTYTNVETCYGDSTGSITIYAHGGVAPIYYTYTRIGSSPENYVPQNIFENVPAGSYYTAIKDANGCTQTSSAFTITQPDMVELTEYNKTDITCYGMNDGTITLQAQGGNGVFEYTIDGGNTWIRNDGYFDNLSAGTYRVNVRDTNLCQGEYFYQLTIREPDQIQIDSVYKYDISCYNYTDGRIVVDVSGGTTPYFYSLNNGEFQESNTFDSLAQGNYWITVRDVNGCIAYSDTVQIIMPENYAVFQTDISEGCSPLTVNFTESHPSAYYQWFFGDGDTAFLENPEHTYVLNGSNPITYQVKAIAYHNLCADTSFTTITVYPQPILVFEISPDTLYYPNATVDITVITDEFEDYRWNFGDGTTFNGVDPQQHTYDSCGIYTISMSAKNSFGCYDTTYKTAVVSTIEPVASISVDKTEGCEPLTVSFDNNSTNAIAYEWYIDNQLTSENQSFTYTFEQRGTYKVDLKVKGYCGTTDEQTKLIYVYPSPKVDFDVEPDTIGVDGEVVFYNNTVDATYYIWHFGDGTISTDENPVHRYQEPGLYSVQLVAYSPNGCIDSLTKHNLVFVSNDFFIKFPTAFTPSTGDENSYFKPVANLVDYCQVTIYDRYGNIVYHTDDYSTMMWDGTNQKGRPLPSDIYIWQALGRYKDGSPINESGYVLLIR